jgi:uncharacterized protein involved in response to NO
MLLDELFDVHTQVFKVTVPYFVRVAYGWLLSASLLGLAAALWDHSGGIWGASRHALTVGFIAAMVFCVGQRVLPAFAVLRSVA